VLDQVTHQHEIGRALAHTPVASRSVRLCQQRVQLACRNESRTADKRRSTEGTRGCATTRLLLPARERAEVLQFLPGCVRSCKNGTTTARCEAGSTGEKNSDRWTCQVRLRLLYNPA
jgi:hypothetical protein